MPNTRRRRFSVQNDIAGRDSSKMQNGLQASRQELDDSKSIVSMKSSKNKMFPNSSKNTSNLHIVAECQSCVSTVKNKATMDKDVTASSSNIDFFDVLYVEDLPTDQSIEIVSQRESQVKERDPRPVNRDKTPLRRDKYPRQHRIKVRSPRRRMPTMEQKATENIHRSVGTGTIDWEQEVEVCVETLTHLSEPVTNLSEPVTNLPEPAPEHQRVSNHSLDDMCRICHGGESLSSELGQLISACACRGTVGRVHVKCLERWLTESGKSRCELCGTRYATRRVHRYGVPRALLMWVLSQNAKQLMVDSLGIMLMSPLAVLAAWLSGRTLAGLMTQDSHATPWPLASTFVLACMTLVCYYCWIVSAATRHALGWWIWYRSQYEVRLQFQETEE